MGSVKIPYYVVKKGQGYWQPTKAMRDQGFASSPCGKDGPKAWAIASDWNERWQRHKTGAETHERPKWPAKTIGDAFERFKRTAVWAEKAPRTREEWQRGFDRISPVFGDLRPTDAGVSLESVSALREAVKRKVSPREAWRTIKIWRALWKVCTSLGYTEKREDPSTSIRNSQPAGRTDRWSAGETARLVKAAWRAKHYGLAAAIAVGWDTMLSPVDIRRLTIAQLVREDDGAYFVSSRAKTGQDFIGTLSRRSERVLDAYLVTAPIEAGVIFRNRSGAPYSRFTLPDDFSEVREMVFPGDKRTLADMRRSGAIEARAGAADPATLSAKMANNISVSNALHRAYQPVDLASVRQADKARKEGRKVIREGNKTRKKLEQPAEAVGTMLQSNTRNGG